MLAPFNTNQASGVKKPEVSVVGITKILFRELCGHPPRLDFRRILRISVSQVMQQVPEAEEKRIPAEMQHVASSCKTSSTVALFEGSIGQCSTRKYTRFARVSPDMFRFPGIHQKGMRVQE